MINKIASTIEMSFDIPDSERQEAQGAYDQFKKVMSSLDVAKRHLNIMYDPFKAADTIPPEAMYEYRGAVYRYKEQIKENFNKVKACAFLAILKLNYFSTDTHISELINTFRDGIGDIEKQVSVLLDILDDLKSKDLKNNIIKGIESVRQESFTIEKLIKERVLDYIDTNILAKDWMSNTSKDLRTEIKEKIPYVTQLFEERQNALNNL